MENQSPEIPLPPEPGQTEEQLMDTVRRYNNAASELMVYAQLSHDASDVTQWTDMTEQYWEEINRLRKAKDGHKAHSSSDA